MAPYEALFFDFDGVLADTEPIHFSCWNAILKPLGAQLDWDTYQKYCIGLHDRPMLEFLCGLSHPPLDLEAVLGRWPEKRDVFLAKATAQPPFPENVVELIRSLDGYRLAVVSSSGREEIEPVLVAGGLRPSFEFLVCGEDVTEPKPSPEPYLLAAKLLGVRNALVIEDSDAGVESGRAAGFDVLRVPHPSQTAGLVWAKLADPANFR